MTAGGRRPPSRAPRGGGGWHLGGLLAAVLLAAVRSSQVPLELLSTGAYPYAKCFDGSQGGFYFQPASDPAAKNKWVLHLQGGGECSTEAECLARQMTAFVSSDFFLPYVNFSWTPDDPVPQADAYAEGWEAMRAEQQRAGAQSLPGRRDVNPATLETWLRYGWWALGDLNTSNPYLYGWNHVLVPYCSQDLHAGQRAGPTHVGKLENVYFAGHWILEAILTELDRRGLTGADTVLLSGHSAGGMGTFLHADWLSERYSSAQVLAAPIAGFYFFASQYTGKGATTGTAECGLSDFTRPAWPSHWQLWAAFVDFSCAFDLNDRPWECMLANVSYPYIDTPVFITQAQTDQIVMELHDCLPSPKKEAWDPEAEHFTKEWHKNISQALGLAVKAKPGWGVFSPACYTHTNFTAKHPIIKKYSFLDALHSWMRGATSKKPTAGIVLEDDCGEFCNPTCLQPGGKKGAGGGAGAQAGVGLLSGLGALRAAQQRLAGLFPGAQPPSGARGGGGGAGAPRGGCWQRRPDVLLSCWIRDAARGRESMAGGWGSGGWGFGACVVS